MGHTPFGPTTRDSTSSDIRHTNDSFNHTCVNQHLCHAPLNKQLRKTITTSRPIITKSYQQQVGLFRFV